jgi:hypothetical protein
LFNRLQEEEWKSKHRESLRREKTGQQAKQEKNKELVDDGKEDEELWARLEELEVREALEKEWELESGTSEEEEEETDNDSDNDSGNVSAEVKESNRTGGTDITSEQIIIGDGKDNLKRRVSWAQPGCLESTETAALITPASPDQRITFAHSDQESESAGDLDNTNAPWPLTPGHINRPTGGIKSILKKTSHETSSPECMPDDYRYEQVSRRRLAEEKPEREPEPWVNPVCDSVVEKSIDEVAVANIVTVADSDASQAAKPKLSKFKAMRSQR